MTLFSVNEELCDDFNKHFVAAGNFFEKSGLSAIYSVCAPTVPVSCRSCSFSFRPFSCHKVFIALCSIGPKKSTGTDQLDPQLLLLAAPVITDALTHFNLTLITESIPAVRETCFSIAQRWSCG